MHYTTQVSLSLKVAKILRIRSAISPSAETLIRLVRAWKRSGSNLLAEEDLAAILGRGKIASFLETAFRDVGEGASFTPLHAESQVIPNAGLGVAVGRALKNRWYTVIQLSFLCWSYGDTTLAAMLVENMRTRYDSGVQGAMPDPDDGVYLAGITSLLVSN